jgi:hypothetical protein
MVQVPVIIQLRWFEFWEGGESIMEGRFPPGVFVSLTDCTEPDQEKKFNEWFEKTYIPHIESLAFIKHTRRYKNLFDEPTFRGHPKYLFLAEVYHDNMKQALKEIRQSDAELKAQGKGFSEMLVKLETVFSKMGPEFRSERTGREVKWLMFALPGCADTSRDTEFNEWYDTKHSPETLETEMFDTGYRYEAVDLHDPMPHHTTKYLSFYESSMPIDIEKMLEEMTKSRKRFTKEDPLWVHLLEVYYSGLFSTIK